jgi:hypothetical protein
MKVTWNQKYERVSITKQFQINAIYDTYIVYIIILDLDHYMQIKMVVDHFTS